MASTTPNIGLTLPTGAEKVSRQIINDNNTIIDGKIGAVPGGQNLQGEIDALNSNIPRYKSFRFENVQVTAGTVGERGAQVSADLDIIGYTTGIVMTYISDSTYAIPVPFISGSKVYVNFYRTSTALSLLRLAISMALCY